MARKRKTNHWSHPKGAKSPAAKAPRVTGGQNEEQNTSFHEVFHPPLKPSLPAQSQHCASNATTLTDAPQHGMPHTNASNDEALAHRPPSGLGQTDQPRLTRHNAPLPTEATLVYESQTVDNFESALDVNPSREGNPQTTGETSEKAQEPFEIAALGSRSPLGEAQAKDTEIGPTSTQTSDKPTTEPHHPVSTLSPKSTEPTFRPDPFSLYHKSCDRQGDGREKQTLPTKGAAEKSTIDPQSSNAGQSTRPSRLPIPPPPSSAALDMARVQSAKQTAKGTAPVMPPVPAPAGAMTAGETPIASSVCGNLPEAESPGRLPSPHTPSSSRRLRSASKKPSRKSPRTPTTNPSTANTRSVKQTKEQTPKPRKVKPPPAAKTAKVPGSMTADSPGAKDPEARNLSHVFSTFPFPKFTDARSSSPSHTTDKQYRAPLGVPGQASAKDSCPYQACASRKNELENIILDHESSIRRMRTYETTATELKESFREKAKVAETKLAVAELERDRALLTAAELKRTVLRLQGKSQDQKPRRTGTVTTYANGRPKGPKKIPVSKSRPELRKIVTSELNVVGIEQDLGTILTQIGNVAFDSSFANAFIDTTLRRVGPGLIQPWENPMNFARVIGCFPFQDSTKQYPGDRNTGCEVFSLPPEPILAGYGAPSIGKRTCGQPLVLTKLPFACIDVGVVPEHDQVSVGTASLLGFQARTLFACIKSYSKDLHSWERFSSEYTTESKRLKSLRNPALTRSDEQMVHRMLRTHMADHTLFDEEGFNQAGKSWTARNLNRNLNRKITTQTQLTVDPQAMPSASYSDKNRKMFEEAVFACFKSCTSIPSLFSNVAMASMGNIRAQFQKSIFVSHKTVEFDRSSAPIQFYGLKNADALEARRATIKGNDQLCAFYEAYFTEFGAGSVPSLDGSNGTFRLAETYEEWRGDGPGTSNAWRKLSKRTAKSFSLAPPGCEAGLDDGVDAVDFTTISAPDYWKKRKVFPTQYIAPGPGPMRDELFSTESARTSFLAFIGRQTEKTFVLREAPDLASTWNVDGCGLTEKDYVAVRKLLGDFSLINLAIADAECSVALHVRYAAYIFGVTVHPAGHKKLFSSLLLHFALNLLDEVRTIWWNRTHVQAVESKAPFCLKAATEWRKARKEKGMSTEIVPATDSGEVTTEMMATRADFELACSPCVPASVHCYSYHMNSTRWTTYAYWSDTDKRDYLVLTPTFFSLHVCSWLGVVHDAHVGFLDHEDDGDGTYRPMSHLVA